MKIHFSPFRILLSSSVARRTFSGYSKDKVDLVKGANSLSANKAGTETVTKFYDDWATQYNADVAKQGYDGPVMVAMRLAGLMPERKDARILDVGSGTGLIGDKLAELGYTNVIALDPSSESLRVAREKGCYKETVQGFAGHPRILPFAENSFDAAVACGVFLPAHCNGKSLRDVIRVVKPGGYFVNATRSTYYVNDHDGFDLRTVSEELVENKVCTLQVEICDGYSAQLKSDSNELDSSGVFLTYTVS